MRFSIRDVLWLTLAVALAVGWWLDHRTLAPYRDQVKWYEAARDAVPNYRGNLDIPDID